MTESIQSTTARIIRQLYGNSEPNKAVLAGLRGA
ncbi:CRISPR-associated protein, partial [Lacticaseibacillus paracasei subsp. paracasei Lpp74]